MVFKNGYYSQVLQLRSATQRQCGPVGLLVDVFILRLQGCKQQLHPAAFARCGRSLAGREGLGRTLMTLTDTDSCQVHVRPEQVERIALDLGCLASSK